VRVVRGGGIAAAAIGVLALGSVACGSPSSAIPAEPACATPAPLPTSRTTPGAVSVQAYFSRIRNGAAALYTAREELRAKYAEDTFYRREEFRPDFIAYADATICAAQGLQELSAPTTSLAEFDQKFDAALIALIEHTEAGREAVRMRNVSDYRAWFAGVDEKVSAVVATSRR
jgi:hypothetical protein